MLSCSLSFSCSRRCFSPAKNKCDGCHDLYLHTIHKQIQTEVGAANAARHAAGRIFRLEDAEFLIDPLGEGGARGPSKGCSVQFKGIKFAYPQRPDAQVGRCGWFVAVVADGEP